MSEERAFQSALDADPGDHFTRGVFADWLDDRGDPRGPGYRALAAGRKHPASELNGVAQGAEMSWFSVTVCPRSASPHDVLDADWFDAMDGMLHGTDDERKALGVREGVPGCWYEFHTRSEADDLAAAAFAKLPARRRAELLDPAAVSQWGR